MTKFQSVHWYRYEAKTHRFGEGEPIVSKWHITYGGIVTLCVMTIPPDFDAAHKTEFIDGIEAATCKRCLMRYNKRVVNKDRSKKSKAKPNVKNSLAKPKL